MSLEETIFPIIYFLYYNNYMYMRNIDKESMNSRK